MRKLITEGSLRRIIRKVLLESPPNTDTTQLKVDQMKLNASRGVSQEYGSNTERTYEANAKGQIVMQDSFMAAYIKAEIQKKHTALFEYLQEDFSKHTKFFSQVGKAVAGTNELFDTNLFAGANRQTTVNAIESAVSNFSGLNIEAQDAIDILEENGICTSAVCNIILFFMKERFFIDTWSNALSALQLDAGSLDISALLRFYAAFGDIKTSSNFIVAPPPSPAATGNDKTAGLIASDSDYSVFANKLNTAAEVNVSQNLQEFVNQTVEGQYDRIVKTFYGRELQLEQRIAFTLALIAEIKTESEVRSAVQYKKNNTRTTSTGTLSQAYRYFVRICLGISVFYNLLKQFAAENLEKQSIVYLKNLDVAVDQGRITAEIIPMFNGLDIIMIEGMSKIVSSEYYRIKIEESARVEIKSTMAKLQKTSQKKKKKPPVTPVPKKCLVYSK